MLQKHFLSVIWIRSSQSTQQVWEWGNPPLLEQKPWEQFKRSDQKEYHRAAHVYKRCTFQMPHIPGYPNRRCDPRKPGNTMLAFCRHRLLHSHPRPAEVMSWPSVSCRSLLTNLADAGSGLGAALTWDSQPPAGDSWGPAGLCPPAKGWTISSSTRNVCACPCVQKHYGQATMCSWNKQKQQLCLDFLSRKFSFFYLLGSYADNLQKVNNAP